MIKISKCLILTYLFITLEVYRLHIANYNLALYHIFFGLTLFLGFLNLLLIGTLNVNRGVRTVFTILILFGIYSFLLLIQNVNDIPREVISMFIAEIVGYCMALTVPLFIISWLDFHKLVTAFLASGLFVYAGSLWHMIVFMTRREIMAGIPLWSISSSSVHVREYLEAKSSFSGFPRFRIPFSGPAGAGVFLSLSGIFLLVLLLYKIRTKKSSLLLIIINSINLLCLFGTFARSSWIIYFVGCCISLIYFNKYNLGSIKRTLFWIIILLLLLIILLLIMPIGNDFLKMVLLRFSPEYTKASNIGHLKTRVLALQYWAQKPIMGLGIGGFFEETANLHTHSTYFTILTERGIIGFILYFSFLLFILRLLSKKVTYFFKYGESKKLAYGIALKSSFVGLLIGHLLYNYNNELIWLFYGMILAYLNLHKS